MLTEISIESYYSDYHHLPVIDVRSPGEFNKGHIPCAVNIALFSDAERAHVGTVYKQRCKDEAYRIGYDYVTPKLQWFVDETRKSAPHGRVVVHCWRGGMRSRAFAQHLVDNGFTEVYVIAGGYKSFRRLALATFSLPYKLCILGGYTGSGKTHILEFIKSAGHQVIDLEGLARHKGSAFGAIGMNGQPTTEQFENDLFEQWRQFDLSKPVWLEDESQNIGHVNIPINLYFKMKESLVFFLDVPREERAKLLVEEYACIDSVLLERAINRISKRLGGLATQQALESLAAGNYLDVALITLHYYDKSYYKGLLKRPQELVKIIKADNTDAKTNFELLMKELN